MSRASRVRGALTGKQNDMHQYHASNEAMEDTKKSRHLYLL